MGEKKKPGRQSKLTPELRAKLLELVSMGNYVTAAARAIGIPHYIVARMKKSDPTLKAEIDAAEGRAECRCVEEIILSGLNKDAKYAQWFLQRKYPERWGDSRHELLSLRRDVEELKKLLNNNVQEPKEPNQEA